MTDPTPWTDCHVHLVNFLQEPADPLSMRRGLLEAGVERAVVFGLPVKKNWSIAEPERPGYYLDGNDPCAYHSATDDTVRRLVPELEDGSFVVAPLTCGFDPTDRLATEHLERLWGLWDRWAGVGELLLRHDDLTNLTIGETPRADHEALVAVLRACAERGQPMSVHHDTGSTGRPRARQYLQQLETLLRAVPDASLVWCHAGSSRGLRPEDQLDVVTTMLERYPRLVVELSWVVLDQVVPDGEVDPRWVALTRLHPDRVVLGSDAVGDPSMIAPRAEQVQRFLAALPAPDRDLVSTGNAGRLWFGEG